MDYQALDLVLDRLRDELERALSRHRLIGGLYERWVWNTPNIQVSFLHPPYGKLISLKLLTDSVPVEVRVTIVAFLDDLDNVIHNWQTQVIGQLATDKDGDQLQNLLDQAIFALAGWSQADLT